MKTTSFKIFITKSPEAAAMIAKALWNDLWEGYNEDGDELSVSHGRVDDDIAFIPKIYVGLYYACAEYISDTAGGKYELILC